jgi:hypothetical protein
MLIENMHMFAIGSLNPFSRCNVKIASHAIQRHVTHQIASFSQGNSWNFCFNSPNGDLLECTVTRFPQHKIMHCSKEVAQKYLSFNDMAATHLGPMHAPKANVCNQ